MIYIRLNIHKYIRLINKLCKYMKKKAGCFTVAYLHESQYCLFHTFGAE